MPGLRPPLAGLRQADGMAAEPECKVVRDLSSAKARSYRTVRGGLGQWWQQVPWRSRRDAHDSACSVPGAVHVGGRSALSLQWQSFGGSSGG